MKRKASARSAVISSDKSNEREQERERKSRDNRNLCLDVCVSVFVGGSA